MGCFFGGMDVVDDVDVVGIGEFMGIYYVVSLLIMCCGCLLG